MDVPRAAQLIIMAAKEDNDELYNGIADDLRKGLRGFSKRYSSTAALYEAAVVDWERPQRNARTGCSALER